MAGNHCEPNREIIYQYLFSDFHLALVAVGFSILAVCTIIANTLTMFVFTRPYMRVGLTVFLTFLSLSDVLYAITLWLNKSLQAIGLLAELKGNTLPQSFLMHSILFSYPWMKIFYTFGAWLVVVTSVERYIAVCHPFSQKILRSTRSASITTAIIFVVSVAVNAPAFLEFHIVFINTTNGSKPSLRPRGNRQAISTYNTIMRTTTHFVGPLIIISVLNVLILREIRRIRRYRDQMNSHRKRDLKNGTMFLIYTFLYVFCHSLPTIHYILEEIFDTDYFFCYDALYLVLVDISHLVLLINTTFSILIYYNYGSKYREAIRREVFRTKSVMFSEAPSPGPRAPMFLSTGLVNDALQRGASTTSRGNGRPYTAV